MSIRDEQKRGKTENFLFKPKGRVYSGTMILLAVILVFTGCDITGSDTDKTVYEYDFRESPESWEPFFTGYNVGWGDKMELTSDYRNLPEPLNIHDEAHYISAINNSDDVKMLFRKQVGNLEPNTTYNVQFTVQFATKVPSGCAGIGGAPGKSVNVIADASQPRPQPITDDDYYRLNLQYQHANDPGNWYQNAILGDIANSRECEEGEEFEIKELTTAPGHSTVTTDQHGNTWLMFGTRSGFEGQTELYYTYFRAVFTRE